MKDLNIVTDHNTLCCLPESGNSLIIPRTMQSKCEFVISENFRDLNPAFFILYLIFHCCNPKSFVIFGTVYPFSETSKEKYISSHFKNL